MLCAWLRAVLTVDAWCGDVYMCVCGRRTFDIHIYGSGPDEGDIRKRAESKQLETIQFHPGIDHASLTKYKVILRCE